MQAFRRVSSSKIVSDTSSEQFTVAQNHFENIVQVSRSLRSVTYTPKLITRQASSGTSDDRYQSILYSIKDRVAYITLNRPHALNAITPHVPKELLDAVAQANADDDVRVIVVSGNGKAFCAGYDLKLFAESERGSVGGSQKMPWDPYEDYRFMHACTEAFMSLWRSLKPTICKVHGYAVAGGSDIALCCDLIVMAEDAKIGYPPSRVWGCPTTAMWTYRVGAERAKRILFTGELIDGKEAARIGLVGEAVPATELDTAVSRLVEKIKTVPTNQLFFQKQVINQVVEHMGLSSAQRLATLLDGMSRHSPEGVAFQKRTQEVGFKQAVHERDTGIIDWSKL
ncbi:putative enoyl-CoA hydratase [Amphiura filiformis]|uniref:putative enoyl-CoA hydratase n=1 Tax=Amphiura filiformis TaxID=82378 RepID=UPI003B222DEF